MRKFIYFGTFGLYVPYICLFTGFFSLLAGYAVFGRVQLLPLYGVIGVLSAAVVCYILANRLNKHDKKLIEKAKPLKWKPITGSVKRMIQKRKDFSVFVFLIAIAIELSGLIFVNTIYKDNAGIGYSVLAAAFVLTIIAFGIKQADCIYWERYIDNAEYTVMNVSRCARRRIWVKGGSYVYEYYAICYAGNRKHVFVNSRRCDKVYVIRHSRHTTYVCV